MKKRAGKVLLIGCGNPARLDDGLGIGLAGRIEKLNIPGVQVEIDYLLKVEHAVAVAACDVVVFADADVSGPEPFGFRRLRPVQRVAFSSHSIAPEEVLGLAGRLFGARTRAYALGIRGYRFDDFGEALCEKARANLDAAVEFLRRILEEGPFPDAPTDRPKETCRQTGPRPPRPGSEERT